MTCPLEGRIALLTGALGSLGRAQAARLAAAGAELILLDRPELDPAPLLATLPPGRARYVGQDLGDLAASAAAVRALGRVDILVNNAALIVNKPFEDFSLEEYETTLRVNSSAAFALAQAVAPAMRERGWGKIINFCSLTLNGRWTGYTPYVASKGALLGLTKNLARELGPHGIRVNALSPGAIVSEAETRVFGDNWEQYERWILENQMLKVRGQPEDVAELVLFLASPISDFITGQNIGIDGGW